MTKYRVIFEDPDDLDAPAKVLIPSQRWLDEAMSGGLPPIWVYWQLQDDEQQAIDKGRHGSFKHDPEKHALQWTAPRIGPLTEEEAMEYLCMKSLPRRVWSEEHNRPMFWIVRTEQVPSDRQFRNAWKMAA
jgi:hypothetical protein|tara:strand:+ start:256 stop:648 length:393 start_codon:yes stop_codon:yes gene_type:complete